jgi:HEAT repeat protein
MQEPFEEGRPKSYWIGALRDNDPEVREQAAICLARMEDSGADAIPELTAALDDEIPTIRWRAAFALFKSRRPITAAIPKLVAGLKDPDNMVRFYSSMCLSRSGQECSQAIPELVDAVKDKQNAVRLFQSGTNARQLAVVAIGCVGPRAEPAVGFLISLLDDEDPVVRTVAVQALGKIRCADAVRPFLVILKNKQNPLRNEVVLALGSMGPKAESAVPALRQLVDDNDEDLRRSASTSLRQIDPGTVPPAP